MKAKLLLGTALVAVFSGTAHADPTLDAVLRRLDAVEQRSARLEQENTDLRRRVAHIGSGPVVEKRVIVKEVREQVATAFKGNAVGHVRVAKVETDDPLLAVGGHALISKSGMGGTFIDATKVDLYGHFDVSADEFKVGVPGQHWTTGIASNISYLGVRVKHDLAPFGHQGYAILGQIETEADIAQTPSVKAALGSRNSFVGLQTPWGTVKLGKNDTPYKEATAEFDPFHETIADYNSIMGNTGGDGRAEFDYRASHAIWYESPVVQGFQFKAFASPGQNSGTTNSNFAYGDFSCTGASAIGNGSGFPGNAQGSAYDTGGLGGEYCTDGSFGTLYGTSLTYHGNGFVGIAAYEMHLNVNRVGDIYDGAGANIVLPNGNIVTGSGVGNEYAVKVGGGYQFVDRLGPAKVFAIFEHMGRDGGTPSAYDERTQNDIYFSGTQSIGRWDVSAAYTHSFGAPGSPGTLTAPGTATDANPGGVQFATMGNSSAASQYSAGLRYNFSKWASIYVVGTDLVNGAGAHNCIGPSGHGYSICSRDNFNNTYGGASIRGASSGLTFVF